MDLLEKSARENPDFDYKLKNEQSRKYQGEDYGLFIKNIENVQGDERDIIIFSLAYARNSQGAMMRNFAWLNQVGGENRLNVAISRAKKKIYVITSIESSDLFVEDLANEGPKLLKKYLEYAYAVSNKDITKVREVLQSLSDNKHDSSTITFDSPFEEEVYNELIGLGYKIVTQVGIGGYRIDLAVYDEDSSSYILGIECDGKLYHSSKIARDRDIYRQKYLESRGWTIHRIWSTNWWHSKQNEITKMIDIINMQKIKIKDKKKQQEDNKILTLIRKHLLNANIEPINNDQNIEFKLGYENISIDNKGKVNSSFNDNRSYEIIIKEIDKVAADLKKKNLEMLQKIQKIEDKKISIPTLIKEEDKIISKIKIGEIECTCKHIFYEHLGECPRCGENTATIMRKKALNII